MITHCLLFLLLQTCTANKETVPVFVIDYDNIMSHITIQPNPFVTVSQDYFTEIMQDAMKKSECIIIFTEENLSTEDLSNTDSLGTPYYHLQKALKQRKAMYIPAVTEPYNLLKQNFQPKASNSFHLGAGVKLQLLRSIKYLYVYFQDTSLDMTRVRTLRKHDIIMREVYLSVRQLKPGPIIAFYTGKVNPVTVEALEYVPLKPAKELPVNLGVMVVTKQSLFRLSGVLAASHTRRSLFTQKPIVEKETRTARALSTTMQYTDFEMQFNFVFREKDWKLANVALMEGGEEVGRTELGVGAPWNWSYFCAEPLSVVNARDGSSITVAQYQVQPIYRHVPDYVHDSINDDDDEYAQHDEYDKGDDSDRRDSAVHRRLDDGTFHNWWDRNVYDWSPRFGRTVNCGPYFSIAILVGLFISIICVLITSLGVLLLFNCETNSRFDEVNQKPLQIISEQHS